MRIEVKGRNLQVTDELRECVERRMDKIGKQVSELAVLEVEVEDTRTAPDPVTAEATLQLKGTTLRAKSASQDAKHAINLVSEDLARQVKRHRDKRRGRRESRAAADQSRTGAQETPVFEEEPSSSL
jgi:ribosome hibernation promoting factor